MRGRLRSYVLVPLLAVACVSALAYLTLFGGETAKSTPQHNVKASAAAKTEAARMPACTGQDKPTNFAHYTLGPRFEGMRQSHAVRRCDRPELMPPGVTMATAGGARHAFRANYTDVTYGDCQASGDSGCALPLSVQTWPACERSAGTYDKAKRPNIRVRGAPAFLDRGGAIEIYTARATVVVSGTDAALVRRAARAVVRMEPGSSFPVAVSASAAGVASRRTLARPARGALQGRLSCRQVSATSARRDGGV